MKSVRICIFSGSRADYGLLKCLAREIKKERGFEVVIIASGSHLSKELGSTVKEIRVDNISKIEEIDIGIDENHEYDMGKLTGKAIEIYSERLVSLEIKYLIVLGDRYEALAVAVAAHFRRIKIIHLHGGETTEGALDDATRNAITQLSCIHFTSTDKHNSKVRRMVDESDHVKMVGPMCIDNIKNIEIIPNEQFENKTRYKFTNKNILMTYHPVTNEQGNGIDGLIELLGAIGKKEFSKHNFLITSPNADSDGNKFLKIVDEFAETRDNVYRVNSLGESLYLNALLKFDLVIGNSSSGIIEAPMMKIPVINVGNRQKGREEFGKVKNVDCDREKIFKTMIEALGERTCSQGEVLQSISMLESPAKQIVRYLKKIAL